MAVNLDFARFGRHEGQKLHHNGEVVCLIGCKELLKSRVYARMLALNDVEQELFRFCCDFVQRSFGTWHIIGFLIFQLAK